MQNKDLARFFPDNPNVNKAFGFVRYNKDGEIEGVIIGEVYVGTMHTDHIPTQEELNAFTVTSVGRDPAINDLIIVEVTTLDELTLEETTTVYEYRFNGVAWSGREVQDLKLATNGIPGIVFGTYGLDYTFNTLVDIVNGAIRNIYIKVGQSYVELSSMISSLNAAIANALGTSGQVILSGLSTTESLVIQGLGQHDSIFFTPSTIQAKATLEEGEPFVTPNTQTSGGVTSVVFNLSKTLLSSVSLEYTIVRGTGDGKAYLCGIGGGSTPVPPTPTNQVADEYGNPVTDEHGNPIEIL